ncbi:MAG: YceI family protein [Nitrospirota bacterium]|nr:YceI family protein [Nitrospirota bacterium]
MTKLNKVVTPVKTGVQWFAGYLTRLDSGFRRNDEKVVFRIPCSLVNRSEIGALVLLLVIPLCADAAPLAREGGKLEFVSKQMGVPVKGSFTRFDGDIVIDEKNPANSRATVTVDIDGIDAGSDDANMEVRRKPWFNVKVYPKAEFVSTSVTSAGNNQYRVAGKLTIKGITRDVTVPVAAKKEKGGWLLEGRFTINRLDFNIGEGAWADVSTVANAVEVNFRVTVPASGVK